MEEEERGWQVGGGLVEEEGEGHERGMGGNRQRKRVTQSSNSVGKTEFLWRVITKSYGQKNQRQLFQG